MAKAEPGVVVSSEQSEKPRPLALLGGRVVGGRGKLDDLDWQFSQDNPGGGGEGFLPHGHERIRGNCGYKRWGDN